MMYRRCRFALLLSVWAHAAAAIAPPQDWDDGRLAVPLIVDDQVIPFPEFAIYLMPGQRFQLSFGEAGASGDIRFQDRTLTLGEQHLEAPAQPGLSRLVASYGASGERAVLNVFTLVPAGQVDARGNLNGYRVGRYPAEPLRGLKIYDPPAGFIEVTAANADTRVSPNFRLGQFVSKQDQGYPRYVTLRPALLLKLEQILAALNHSGRSITSLVVMSGFRTPWYNQAIGNVPYSRHTWGDAADIYVDQSPADGVMDDLNGDGKVNKDDARWFAEFVDAMSQRGEFGSHVGGLGVYDSNAAHGPFIHVDVRGTPARW